MIRKDLAPYVILAATALYRGDVLAQKKPELCGPPPLMARADLIATGKMSSGIVYESFKPDKQTIITIMYSPKDQNNILGYAQSVRIPNDPSNPDSLDYRTHSFGCVKMVNEFRKVSLGEVIDKFSR